MLMCIQVHVRWVRLCICVTGPPSVHSPYELEGDELLPKKMKLEPNHDLFSDLQNGEEYGFKLAGNDEEEFEQPQSSEQHHNEQTVPLIQNNVDQLNKETEEDEEVQQPVTPPPPPIPVRSHSLSPSPNQTPYHDNTHGGNGGYVNIYGEREVNGMSTRPFLGKGRGGDNASMASPPLPVHTEARSSAAAVNPEDDVPPPLPAKQGKRKPQGARSPDLHDIHEEEQALISILDELERTVSRMPEASAAGSVKEKASVVNRKKQVEGVSLDETL